MRVLLNILWKEARELLTPQMLAPFLAAMVMLIVVGKAIRGERERSKGPTAVMVADRDRTAESRRIVGVFKSEDVVVTESEGDSSVLLARAKAAGIAWVVIIPEGLADSIAALGPAEVAVYNIVRGISVTQALRGFAVKTILGKVNDRIAAERLERAYPGAAPQTIQSPVRPKQFVVVKDRVAAGSADLLQGIVFSQLFMIPIILLMILIYSSQIIAASIGQEKENKTLETLLTVPISRVTIVIGKMLGAAAVALVISCVFIFAMVYYTGSFAEEMPSAGAGGASILSQLDIGLTLQSYLLVGVALFLAVLCALSLATLLAIFADDAKSAQMTVTPLMMLVLLPYFFSMFFDIETASLPVKLLIYAIPFSYPFLTPRSVIFGNYGLVFAGYAYMAAFAAVCIFVAARIFNTDRILTAKLRFGRRRREQANTGG